MGPFGNTILPHKKTLKVSSKTEVINEKLHISLCTIVEKRGGNHTSLEMDKKKCQGSHKAWAYFFFANFKKKKIYNGCAPWEEIMKKT